MGSTISCIVKQKKIHKTRQFQERHLSDFYLACRNGEIDKVKNLVFSMSIDQINRFEPNGSTALHAASYYGHGDIVQLLLNAGACRTLRNFRCNLTPYEEARNEDIQKLFSYVNLSIPTRFIGSSSKPDWSLDTVQAAQWKIHLSKLLQPELSFQEIILYLQKNYLNQYVILSPRELEKILGLFRYAYDQNDATYIVRAYTAPTQFYAIVNKHLAQYLLKCFRFDNKQIIIEQSIGYLASIFIHRPELKFMEYTGIVYRGLLLHYSDLEIYTINTRLLNKSFLSTSKERRVASVYAGIGDRNHMRTTVDKIPLQYTALCIYKIKNKNTALDISCISEIPYEHEVLIMPLCAFQVQYVRRNDEDDNDIQIEIMLEECDESERLKRKNIQEEIRPKVT